MPEGYIDIFKLYFKNLIDATNSAKHYPVQTVR